MHFVEWKSLCFDLNFTEVCKSQGSNEQEIIFGSDNGLVPNKQQAIIRTDDNLVY